MPNIIEITDFHAPELDPYARLTQNQLRNRLEPEKGIFIAESPKVIDRALDAGYEPVSLLMERRQITGPAAGILSRCGDAPVYTADRELLAALTGFELTRGVLCAFRRPAPRPVEELCRDARRVAVLEGIVDSTNVGAIFRSAAAERVAAGGVDEDGVHVQRRRRAEDGPHIGGIHHIFQHGDAPRPGADLLRRGQGRAAHGAQHPAGQVEAGELRQHVQRRGVHRDIRVTARQDLRALAGNVLRLHQEGHGYAPGIQRPPDHQRALRNKQGVGRVGAVHQLVFGGAGVYVQLRRKEIGYLYDAGHQLISSSNFARASR